MSEPNDNNQIVEIPNVEYPASTRDVSGEKPKLGEWWFVQPLNNSSKTEAVEIVPYDDSPEICFWANWGLVRESYFDCWQFLARIPSPDQIKAKDEKLETLQNLFNKYADCCQRLLMSVMYEHCKPASHGWPGKPHTENIVEGVSFLIDKIQRIESASAAKDEALKGWIKLHDDMIALGGDVKALSNEQIANFAVEQARLIRLTLASLSEGSR